MITKSLEETQNYAKEVLGKIISTRDKSNPQAIILCLEGTLGSGKTSFVQSLGLDLGINEIINSPTYTIINEYPIVNTLSELKTLYHLDLYRINNEWEILELEFENLLKNQHNIVCIEWPLVAQSIVSKYDIYRIMFDTLKDDTRSINTAFQKSK
jgi:tRNA threonylcarbamoyladenosine biosynthesis protein TsaE